MAVAGFVLSAMGGLLAQPALADPPAGRVVVVGAGQGPVPLGPTERVTARKDIVINGQPFTIVQVQNFPGKPKFVVGLPVGVPPVMMFFPFPQDHVDNGITVGKRAFVGPGGRVTVLSFSRNANGLECTGCKMVFPPGAVLIPDPPQPPGLMYFAQKVPADPQTEAAVLADLGLPNTLQTEVWFVPSGEFHFFINGQPPGPPVQIRPAADPGDMNCDGAIDGGDIEGFVSALTDTAGYETAKPECGFYYADVNDDETVDADDIGPFVQMLLAD